MGCDLFPEAAQVLQAVLWRIASDDRGVNRADRNPRHPVGQIFPGRQRLINSRLIAAKRTSALQNQGNLFVIGWLTRRRVSIGHKSLSWRNIYGAGCLIPQLRDGKTRGGINPTSSERRFDRLTPVAPYSRQCKAGIIWLDGECNQHHRYFSPSRSHAIGEVPVPSAGVKAPRHPRS